MDEHQVFVVKGALDLGSPNVCKIKANEFVPLELFFQEWKFISHAFLQMPATVDETLLKIVEQKLNKGKTPLSLVFHENGKKLLLQSKKRVTITNEIIEELKKHNVDFHLKV